MIEKIYSIDPEDILVVLTIDEYLGNLDKPLYLYRKEVQRNIKSVIQQIQYGSSWITLIIQNNKVYENRFTKFLTIQTSL